MGITRRQRASLSAQVGRALLACLSAGCVSAPEVGPSPEVGRYAPAELIEPHVPDAPQVEPGAVEALTLDEALAYADANAPTIRAARARVGLAEADVIEAEIVFPANPQLGVSLGGRTVGGATGFEYQLTLQQQLEVAGEPGLRRDAAQARQRAALAQLNDARWTVHVEVHRRFVDLALVATRRLQAERFVRFSESLREVAGRQVGAGEAAPLILLVADADLAQTQAALIEINQREVALRGELAALVGWPSPTLPPIVDDLPPVRRAPALSTLLARMAEHHPSLRARELAVVASQAQLALEQREAWPEPTVGLSYTSEATPEAGAAGPGIDVWMFNLTLPLPVWRRNQGGQARAAAQLQVDDRERTARALALRGGLVAAAATLDAAVDRVELYGAGVMPQLTEHLRLLQRAYELGEVDVHQVSQTRQRLLDVAGKYLDALIVYHEAAVRLEGFVGAALWTDPAETGP